jgi:hypothetical protein
MIYPIPMRNLIESNFGLTTPALVNLCGTTCEGWWVKGEPGVTEELLVASLNACPVRLPC